MVCLHLSPFCIGASQQCHLQRTEEQREDARIKAARAVVNIDPEERDRRVKFGSALLVRLRVWWLALLPGAKAIFLILCRAVSAWLCKASDVLYLCMAEFQGCTAWPAAVTCCSAAYKSGELLTAF